MPPAPVQPTLNTYFQSGLIHNICLYRMMLAYLLDVVAPGNLRHSLHVILHVDLPIFEFQPALILLCVVHPPPRLTTVSVLPLARPQNRIPKPQPLGTLFAPRDKPHVQGGWYLQRCQVRIFGAQIAPFELYFDSQDVLRTFYSSMLTREWRY